MFDFLAEVVGLAPENILVFGRSLGSGPATYLASQRRCGALVLFTPFLSVRHASKAHVGCLGVCAPDIFRNCDHIARVRAPTFIVHGKKDEVVPHQSSQQLYKLLADRPPLKQLLEPEDMMHNRFRLLDDFILPSLAFLQNAGVLADTHDQADLSDSIVAYIRSRRARPSAGKAQAALSPSPSKSPSKSPDRAPFEAFEYK